jgi:hypothetical protein
MRAQRLAIAGAIETDNLLSPKMRVKKAIGPITGHRASQ